MREGRRFGTIEELREEVIAWATGCNAEQKGVDWQFITEDARIKLESPYPKFVMEQDTSQQRLSKP